MDKCGKHWTDVFVTHDDDSENHDVDNYACDVQSVDLDYRIMDGKYHAIVVDRRTEWLLPTWSRDYKTYPSTTIPHPSIANDTLPNVHYESEVLAYKRFISIKVGDVIRVGNLASFATTDYVTVLEKVKVAKVYNGTDEDLPISIYQFQSTNDTLAPNTDGAISNIGTFIDVQDPTGVAQYALKVSARMNCTGIQKVMSCSI